MWLWRRRSPFETLALPRRVFISHSYKDARPRERLLNLLPKGVEPFVFPPITVPPEQMVSDKLLDAIRECDGLIYLEDGASAESFWVALERDYALRIGKAVLAYDHKRGSLTPDLSPPLGLAVYLSYPAQQGDAVSTVEAHMRRRQLEVLRPGNDAAADLRPPRLGVAPQKVVDDYVETAIAKPMWATIQAAINSGGYLVSFWTRSDIQAVRDTARRRISDESDIWQFVERQFAVRQVQDRILFALLDNTPLPFNVPDINVVQLYGDEASPDFHRIDDLIVRLYWLIYRNTRQNQLS